MTISTRSNKYFHLDRQLQRCSLSGWWDQNPFKYDWSSSHDNIRSRVSSSQFWWILSGKSFICEKKKITIEANKASFCWRPQYFFLFSAWDPAAKIWTTWSERKYIFLLNIAESQFFHDLPAQVNAPLFLLVIQFWHSTVDSETYIQNLFCWTAVKCFRDGLMDWPMKEKYVCRSLLLSS